MLLFSSEQNVAGYTFIMPSVSIGNVGQLAVDMLVSSVKPEKWATAWHSVFIPTVGGDPYSSQSSAITSPCEVFVSHKHKLVIMQLRSPLIKERRGDFLSQLVTWIKTQNFERVVILTSLSSHERSGANLTSNQLRYICSENVDRKIFSELKWTELEKGTHDKETEFYMPQGGFAKQLFKLCCSHNIPTIVLLKYCNEGCNTPDAQTLAQYLNSWIKLVPDNNSWILPPSWNLLFGNAPPNEIF